MSQSAEHAKSPLYFNGANPTADLALFRPGPSGWEVLLIVRGLASEACPGLPAFPGGFIESSTGRGSEHRAVETPREAAARELTEETGLVVVDGAELVNCGVWETPGRDPRNEEGSFTRSHLFCTLVAAGFGPEPQGLDDAMARGTRWVALNELAGREMAFDHGLMLSAACAKLGLPDPGARSWSLSKLWARRDSAEHQQTAKPLTP